MPPITQEGQRAKGRIAEFRQNINNGATPAQARATVRQIEAGPTGMATGATPAAIRTNNPTIASPNPSPFKIQTPETVNPATLQNAPGRTEVFARRDQLQAQTDQKNQLNTDYTNLTNRISAPLSATPFQNPQQFIEETLLRRPTESSNALNERTQTQAQGFRNLATDLQNIRQQTRDELGVVDLQANLAETRNRIAERTTQLRQNLRDFETNAQRRGVAREFVNSEKAKVQADAAAELADLAIIESAQAGNLEMAQKDIDRAVDAKIQAFQFENAAIETEIERLKTINTEEADARSEQLQIALNERTRNIEQAVADEKQKLTFLSEAAANGADQGTLEAIRKATNVGEAALMAGPFIGRLDRMKSQADVAQGWAGLKLRQDEFNLAKQKYENEANDFGTGTITMSDGQKAVVDEDGSLVPISEIDFNNPTQVDALPVGSLTKAVLQGFAKTKDFTPTQKGEIMAELQKIGFNPNTYITNKLNGLVQSWMAVPESSKGYVEGLKFWESKTNEDVAGFESQKTLLTREIARLFDVGVLSDQDVASYKDAMPSRQDADLQVVLRKAGGISGAATGKNTEGVGKYVQLPDGRTAITGLDGNTLLDPATGKPLE